MDMPKVSNSYISKENPVSEIFESNNKNTNGHSFHQKEEETHTEHQDDYRDTIFKSANNDSEIFLVSTNEWLLTWRPLI